MRGRSLREVLKIKFALVLGLSLFLVLGGAVWSIRVGKPTAILLCVLMISNAAILFFGIQELRRNRAPKEEGHKKTTDKGIGHTAA